MMKPSSLSVRRSCAAKRLDLATAWAVVIGPADHPNLFGVRATEAQAQVLGRHVRRMGSTPAVVPVSSLLAES